MNPLIDVLNRFYAQTANSMPNFFYGLIILFIGFILGNIVKRFFTSLVVILRINKILKSAGMAQEKGVRVWTEILSEIFKWITIVLFLIPAVEIWGLSRMVNILNNFLFYLPNVVAAVIIGLVGYIIANLTYDIVLNSLKSFAEAVSRTMARIAQYAIVVFTALVVLNQLGVAQELIRILFTGIVFMLALAGGLAFGLGGQETARELLRELKKNLTKK